MSIEPLYLDFAASTPLDERVLETMLPYLKSDFGNAASRQHAMGRAANAAVEKARGQLADLIGADPREIVFTSGATESNNLLLKGVAHAKAYERSKRLILSARTEHHAVLDPLRQLEEHAGMQVTLLNVDSRGAIDLNQLKQELEHEPLLVSLMHVNNELGSIHPLAAIGELCRSAGTIFHTDASQSLGKLPIDVNAMGIDALSLSAHKFYGPKGVGALFLRRRSPRVRCAPLFDGGGHEGGRRSGTLNVPGIVGLGAAAAICAREMEHDTAHVTKLRAQFESSLRGRLPEVTVNGPGPARLLSICNLSFQGADAESLLSRFERVCASSSSACTSAQLQESHVLRAIGASQECISSSLRFSFGRCTTLAQIDSAVDEIVRAVEQERREGPRAICSP